ncbi:hypothetical protein [Aquiflexum sp.]|uniref:hypothetical protein n=1 Tax=Aquiflexum sp. TaxID=1872584 RepID=UPI0035931F6D
MTRKTHLSAAFMFGLAVCLIMGGCIHESITEDSVQPSQESNLSTEELAILDDDIGISLRMNPSNQNRLLAGIRAATAKYHRLSSAEADKYVLDPHCVEVPNLGGMGHHAVNMSRIGPFVNPAEPGVLVYEPMKNGGFRLGAVEYLVPAGPWHADPKNVGPPMLGNQPFDDHTEMTTNEKGEPVNAKGGPPFPHYQLHVWLWTNNPKGIYTPFNPNVSCQ